MTTKSAHHHLRLLTNQLAGTPAQIRTLVGQTARQLRQLSCGVAGHDMLLHFNGPRVSLVCASCGYESPGWSLAGGASAPAAPDKGAGRTPRAA